MIALDRFTTSYVFIIVASCDDVLPILLQPGAYVTHSGTPFIIKNAICIHEEDAGVLWKHTDYRPGGRHQTVRSRRLVVSMVCTLANYGMLTGTQIWLVVAEVSIAIRVHLELSFLSRR